MSNNIHTYSKKIVAEIDSYFSTESDLEKTVRFFLLLFESYIINVGKPNGYNFARCLAEINAEIAKPAASILLSKNFDVETQKRLVTWEAAHKEFERRVKNELVAYANKLY